MRQDIKAMYTSKKIVRKSQVGSLAHYKSSFLNKLELYCVLLPTSVLKTFIHDPLVEWEKVKGRLTSPDSTNEKVCLTTSSVGCLVC